MQILLASPDRDLLQCCQALLQADLGPTVTAFDGTQVLTLLAGGGFDLVILDHAVPRVGCDAIVRELNERGVPVLVLLDRPITTGLLTQAALPCGYLVSPFPPEALIAATRDILTKAGTREPLCFGDLQAVPADFRLTGGARLTAEELDAFDALIHGRRVGTEAGVFISALNGKLAQISAQVRIRYLSGKGFQLVTEHE